MTDGSTREIPSPGYAAFSFDNRRLTPGLEGNSLGDPADQPESIYVPDAYEREPNGVFRLLSFFTAMQILAQDTTRRLSFKA